MSDDRHLRQAIGQLAVALDRVMAQLHDGVPSDTIHAAVCQVLAATGAVPDDTGSWRSWLSGAEDGEPLRWEAMSAEDVAVEHAHMLSEDGPSSSMIVVVSPAGDRYTVTVRIPAPPPPPVEVVAVRKGAS